MCDAFTKTLAPGYRVGWTAPGRYRAQVEYLKFVSTCATAVLPQMAITDFLADGGFDHHLRKIRKQYAELVHRMSAAVSRYFPPGTKVTRPTGGHVLWVDMPERVRALDLYELAMREKISIAPGPIFSPKQKFQNCIGINCGNPWSERIEHAVGRLGGLAAQLTHRR